MWKTRPYVGIELIGTTVKALNIRNNIVYIERDSKRSFGININDLIFDKDENSLFAQLVIDLEVEVEQSEEQKCSISLSLEGAFGSIGDVDEGE